MGGVRSRFQESNSRVQPTSRKTPSSGQDLRDRELTLDEAWKDSFPDAGICQPGLEVMLDHAVESRCLGAARGVFGRRSCLAWFSHEQIVGPGSCQNQEVSSFEFPQCNVHEESCGARLSEIRRNPYTCLTRNPSARVALVQLIESLEPTRGIEPRTC